MNKDVKTEIRGEASATAPYQIRWFWAGFFASIPSYLLVRERDYLVSLVMDFQLIYALFPALLMFIAGICLREWKKDKSDAPPQKNSLAIVYFLYSQMFVLGIALGFATWRFIGKLH